MSGSAKQSISPRQERVDCFVALLLAMTSTYDSAFPRRDSPELCMIQFRPTKGVGNAGRPVHPQPRVEKSNHTSVVTTGPPEIPGAPARNGFNGFLRAPR